MFPKTRLTFSLNNFLNSGITMYFNKTHIFLRLYTFINNIMKKNPWLTLRPKGNYKQKGNVILRSREQNFIFSRENFILRKLY